MEGPTTSNKAEPLGKREVTLVTPVITSPWIIDESMLRRQLSFNKNDLLHLMRIPSNVTKLGRTMVIDLPIENIENFVAEQLSWLPLQPDA